ncbi:MAG: hypothetical protein Q9184_006904 [Pyrenodesmia sp. 2 TL-2023]
MSKLLVVVGATGNQGSSVINAVLQHDPSYKIRGITRDTSTAAAKALSDKGVEMVVADRYNVLALRLAFKVCILMLALCQISPFSVTKTNREGNRAPQPSSPSPISGNLTSKPWPLTPASEKSLSHLASTLTPPGAWPRKTKSTRAGRS